MRSDTTPSNAHGSDRCSLAPGCPGSSAQRAPAPCNDATEWSEWTVPLGRRSLLGAGLGLALPGAQAKMTDSRTPLRFPRDAGGHPDYAIEWWYVTGYTVADDGSARFGFQVTFFRSRVPHTQGMKSRLAARQLVFGHAAITDVSRKKFWHAQRIARSSGAARGENPADTAWVGEQDTDIGLQDWSLKRNEHDLRARVISSDFSLNVTLKASQPVLLQGDRGLSRKGPDPDQSSYYYSIPHLQVGGELVLQGQRHTISAGSTAWLDHEWSQQMMPPQAVGWDWIGINLFDGSALTVFRLRDRAGNAVWDGGSFRIKDSLFVFQRGEAVFKAIRHWKSPVSRAIYPVEWIVRTPADFYTVRALVDNQEMDSRASTGNVYWEGLCEVWDSQDKRVGRGYLEMTGYANPIRI